jgi:hypothetical protein
MNCPQKIIISLFNNKSIFSTQKQSLPMRQIIKFRRGNAIKSVPNKKTGFDLTGFLKWMIF